MSLRYLVLAGAVSIFALSGDASAQTATQVVRFEVRAVNQVAFASPTPMVIGAAAGSARASVSSRQATYAVRTSESNQKITASLDRPLPMGVTLEVMLAAPEGASSRGAIPLHTSGADVVTGISSTNASSLPMTYRLSAAPAVRMSRSAERTVTFTIVSGS
jgi:hypothetical protein